MNSKTTKNETKTTKNKTRFLTVNRLGTTKGRFDCVTNHMDKNSKPPSAKEDYRPKRKSSTTEVQGQHVEMTETNLQEATDPRKYRPDKTQEMKSNDAVTSQPSRELPDVPRLFTLDMFDDVSNEVFSTMTRLHKSHPALESVIKTTACDMYRDTASQFFRDLNSIPYEDMVNKLVTMEETLISNDVYLHYTGVSFMDEDGNLLPGKRSMTKGRAYLTDKRLLLLSAEEASVCSLEGDMLDPKSGKPQNYKLSTFCGDTLHFQSIPVEGILGLELHTTSGIKSISKLTGIKSCCSQFWESICCCFKSCCSCSFCHMSCCKKRWESHKAWKSAQANRYMTIGALMPPWDTKTMVRIYIDNTVQMCAMIAFISELQSFAKNLIHRNYKLTTT
ncbi:uncharacterized protein [Ptychodera flava]|uniref:uncharacterized protein isoform X2 n=1 Tax=Ptychodera flava TaxID=63121 RepID=UPI00396A39CD